MFTITLSVSSLLILLVITFVLGLISPLVLVLWLITTRNFT